MPQRELNYRKQVEFGRDQLELFALEKCPSYRGVHLTCKRVDYYYR